MRASGVLMHISSLPGDFGIGTFGKNAYKFVDFLESANQTYWQILPLCPTSFGDSPYQSFSTFAGNPYFIDLEALCEKGLLDIADVEKLDWGKSETSVDYALVFENRKKVFEKVGQNFFKNTPKEYDEFCEKNAFWLDDFALFMAVKDEFEGASFSNWDKEIRTRESHTLQEYKQKTIDSQNYYKMLQFLFFEQWNALKNYANEKGIKIIGDLPIYVAADSADVWANPDQFMLDDDMQPVEVAGCPPDAFSKTGQLWGNPLYNWDKMKKDGYSWWVSRIREAFKLYDVVRIDHFRGFDSYYCIKAGSVDATKGVWREGPKMDLFKTIKAQLGTTQIIAEDLGLLTPSVKKLLKQSKFPGMKVLQFAFNADEESDYLPHNFSKNCVVYTGTHDNDTILGWQKTSRRKDVKFAKKYLNTKRDIHWAMISAALSSVADTAVVTMQDLLGLGSSARMNVPSTVGENWKWRMKAQDLVPENFEKLGQLTKLYSRERKVK